MSNKKISEMIEQLKNAENHSKEADTLISLLEEKQSELDDDASDEQVEQAIKECILKHMSGTLGLSGEEESDEEMQSFMKNATDEVKAFFAEDGWHYKEIVSRPNLVVYELGVSLENCSMRMRVHIEASPKVCRIDAFLPFTADKTYDYLLCQAIVRENYPRRYGALQYDERDGEVSYRYSFPISHGLYKDDLKHIIFAVASSADDSCLEMKKHCVGKYKKKDINEILNKINTLVSDLSDDSE